MAKKLIDVQANGFKSYVDATAAAVGAEPALGNPGVGNWWLSTFSGIRMWVATIPWGEVSKSGAVASDVGAEPALGNPGSGTWFLKTISGVRSWVAQISWASVDKTGAVASDVGALPSLTLGGDVDANSINSGASCVVKFQGVTSWANFPFANSLLMSGKGGVFTQLSGKDSGISQCWTDLTDGGTYRRNYVTTYGWSPWYTDWDSYNLPVGSTGKALLATASQAAARSAISALPVANPTATGTLTAPDVVVSNLAGSGSRPAALDSTGKLVASSRGFLWSDAAKDFNASSSNLSMLSATSAQRKIAANTWVPGKVLQFKIQSIISSASPPSTSSTFKFMMGPDGTFTSPYYTIVNIVRSLAAGQWSISSVITLRCVTTGTSGSFYYTVDTIISNATGSTMHHDVLSSYTGYTGNTIDTTIDRWIDFTEDGVYTDIYGVSSSAEWIA